MELPSPTQSLADLATSTTASSTFRAAATARSHFVRFRWHDTSTTEPHWDQAFSPDNGSTWEINWIMRFHRS